ncbi:hypothetical protein NDU88_006789 [Pleurodeles waltl]|uniref:Uncharacterized protein n=1 Tax=Pleurodeles waltl TaxID=8319 RepID=A0AAV7X2J3_PLEWA|nr:hypothetical protein NDU88_006789 [Pleurodeles waltl]
MHGARGQWEGAGRGRVGRQQGPSWCPCTDRWVDDHSPGSATTPGPVTEACSHRGCPGAPVLFAAEEEGALPPAIGRLCYLKVGGAPPARSLLGGRGPRAPEIPPARRRRRRGEAESHKFRLEFVTKRRKWPRAAEAARPGRRMRRIREGASEKGEESKKDPDTRVRTLIQANTNRRST